MTKQETLERWTALEPDQPMLRHMTVIPYKSKGSTYGCCGIRIDGNPKFIDAVLSHLKELIAGEGDDTRLQLSRSVVDGRGLGKSFENSDTGAECVYIRLCERGDESKHVNRIISAMRERRAK